MKRIIPLAATIMLCALTAPAHADAWADYNNLMSHYYLIDREVAAGINCAVSASPLDAAMQQMPALAPQITEQLKPFRVSVRPGGDISFTTPKMHIDQNPPEAGVQVTKGLATVVGGVEQMARGVLETLTTQKQEKLKGLTVKSLGATTTVTYSTTEGTPEDIETTYAGDTDTTKETTSEGVTESTTHYVPLNGKLAIGDSKARRNGAAPLEGTLKVEYQQVGKVWFPAHITTDFKSGTAANQHIVVTFTDCTGN